MYRIILFNKRYSGFKQKKTLFNKGITQIRTAQKIDGSEASNRRSLFGGSERIGTSDSSFVTQFNFVL